MGTAFLQSISCAWWLGISVWIMPSILGTPYMTISSDVRGQRYIKLIATNVITSTSVVSGRPTRRKSLAR